MADENANANIAALYFNASPSWCSLFLEISMSTLDAFQIFPPSDWPAFERLCRDIYAEVWGDPYSQLHGRSGQPQHGIDVYGMNSKTGEYEGVQCKGRDARYGLGLTEQELLNAVEEAKKFSPTVRRFIIATTARSDVKIQDLARQISIANKNAGLFEVIIESWDRILSRLSHHEHLIPIHFPYLRHELDVRPEYVADRRVYPVNQLKIRRQFIFRKPIGRAQPLRITFALIGGAALAVFMYVGLSPLFGKGFHGSLSSFLALPVFGISFFIAARANALLKHRFTDFLPPFRRVFLEADETGKIFMTRLRATCPECQATMDLRVVGDWRIKTEEVFVCSRNSNQHRIDLDPTLLEEVGSEWECTRRRVGQS